MKKYVFSLLAIVLALFMVACDPSTPPQTEEPRPNNYDEGLVDIKYEEGFNSLLNLLNVSFLVDVEKENEDGTATTERVSGFSTLTLNEESIFSVMNVEIGSITLTEEYEEITSENEDPYSNYAYNAVFKAGTHSTPDGESLSVTVVVGDAEVEGEDVYVSFRTIDNVSSFSIQLPKGKSSLGVTLMGFMPIINATLPMEVSLSEDGSVVVAGRSYTANEVRYYSAINGVLEDVLLGTTLEQSITSSESDLNEYNFITEDEVEGASSADYTGNIIIGNASIPVSFTLERSIKEGDESYSKSFLSLIIDGVTVSAESLEKINSPYIPM